MSDFLRDALSGAVSTILVAGAGALLVVLGGLGLRFAWIRRVRNRAVRALNVPRVEAMSRYGISLDNWSPVGSVDDPPPGRGGTLMWALENGGGPLTTTGSRMRTITLTTQKPVAFELQRVWVTYTRQDLPDGTAFYDVSDGLGAGERVPARFVAALGHEGRATNRFAAKHVSDFDLPQKEAPVPYRLSDATHLDIDLLLSFLTEGVYTYSVEVEVAVNGVSRTLKVEKALIGDQELPLKMVFAREPAMVHEEFTEYPHTRWLPGPRPEM